MSTRIPPEVRAAVRERDLERCVRCGTRAPRGQWHHRRSRRVTDDHQHCPCNGVWLCRTCHEWVHAHPLLARQSGLIVSVHEREPFSVVVTTAFGPRSQDCEGYARFLEGEP